jgi:Fe-S cluster assembly scaffold protein SufB
MLKDHCRAISELTRLVWVNLKERSLLLMGFDATYVEGCTAPVYSEYSLHAAVVEVFVKKNARFRYKRFKIGQVIFIIS